jgi:hypothetical protein
VSWVAPAKYAYQKTHRIYPVPEIYKDLAIRYMPRIWVHPESWQPIDFDDPGSRSGCKSTIFRINYYPRMFIRVDSFLLFYFPGRTMEITRDEF